MKTNLSLPVSPAKVSSPSQSRITETFTIEGMTCAHCVRAVSNALKGLMLEVNKLERGSATVTYEPGKVHREQIVHAITKCGYTVK